MTETQKKQEKKETKKSETKQAQPKKQKRDNKFNPNQLRSYIQQGMSAKQIQDRLDINRTTLMNHILQLQQMDNILYQNKIPGITRGAGVKFNPQGIHISKGLLQKSPFNEGDTFSVHIDESEQKMVLQKI